jgi:hypothetical protein
VIASRVADVLCLSDWYIWIHKLVVFLDEEGPFVVLWHGDGSDAELFYRFISGIGLPLQDSGVRVVCFLDLADNDGLQLSSGGLQIQVRLRRVSLLADSLSRERRK